MIKCGKLEDTEQCILYSKDGSKVLGRFPFSKHGGEEGAKKAAAKRERVVQYFKEKHQGLRDALEAFGAPAVLKYVLDKTAGCATCQEIVKAHVEADDLMDKAYKPPPGWNDPKSWLGSKAGADAVRKKAWAAMGGKEHTCAAHMKGRVDDPDAFCASLKDRVEGTTKWRGKKKKAFADAVEDALDILKEEEETDLDNIDLSELEAWLSGQDDVEPEPEAEPEPEPVAAEPEPEEMPNDFRTFLLRDHAERQATVLALLNAEEVDDEP